MLASSHIQTELLSPTYLQQLHDNNRRINTFPRKPTHLFRKGTYIHKHIRVYVMHAKTFRRKEMGVIHSQKNVLWEILRLKSEMKKSLNIALFLLLHHAMVCVCNIFSSTIAHLKKKSVFLV